jgi:hypothetical protein
MFLRNVGVYLQVCTGLQPRRTSSSSSCVCVCVCVWAHMRLDVCIHENACVSVHRFFHSSLTCAEALANLMPLLKPNNEKMGYMTCIVLPYFVFGFIF